MTALPDGCASDHEVQALKNQVATTPPGQWATYSGSQVMPMLRRLLKRLDHFEALAKPTPSSPASAPSPAGGVREALARRLYKTYMLTTNRGSERIDLSSVDWDEWFDTNAGMPLSGPPFVALWNAMADAALSSPATPEPTNGPEFHEHKDDELKRIAARMAELSPSSGLFCDGGDYVLEFRWTTDGELPATPEPALAGGRDRIATVIQNAIAEHCSIEDEEIVGTGRASYRAADRILSALTPAPAPDQKGSGHGRDDPFRPAIDVDADDDYYPSREED